MYWQKKNDEQRNDFHQQKKKKAEKDYEVDALIDHRTTDSEREFLVRWENYGDEHNTWIAESNLNCPRILKAYLKKHNL